MATKHGRTLGFECFIVVRDAGCGNVEIHTVGMSGAAMDEVLDFTRSALENILFERLLSTDPDHSEGETEIVPIGKHPDAPSGFRLTEWHRGTTEVANCLRTVMDAANIVEAR